jgi:hypothetical protein
MIHGHPFTPAIPHGEFCGHEYTMQNGTAVQCMKPMTDHVDKGPVDEYR